MSYTVTNEEVIESYKRLSPYITPEDETGMIEKVMQETSI